MGLCFTVVNKEILCLWKNFTFPISSHVAEMDFLVFFPIHLT